MSKLQQPEPNFPLTSNSKSQPKRSVAASQPIQVHLVSESTGGLARHMVVVAMSQFPAVDHELHEHPFCMNTETLREARNTIALEFPALVFSALTQPRLRRSLAVWCTRRQINHWELIQPLIDLISMQTGRRPVHDASCTHRCNDDYLKRIDAWEYTLQHDDSRRLETIGTADLILLGVSRVGKTPLAAYLGSSGFRVANISLARDAAVPPEVKAHREKTIGLTIDAERLAAIRKRRFEQNRFGQAIRRNTGHSHSYCSRKSALDDVLFAEQQFRRLGIQTLDMTDMTVEESASRILNLLQLGHVG